MGHILLGVLPKYPRWREVIKSLDNAGVPASIVADQVIDGSKDYLASENTRQAVSYYVWLLSQLALASRQDNFVSNLKAIGINVTERSSATEFMVRSSKLGDIELSRISMPNAFNNIANLAYREALSKTIMVHSNTLFGSRMPEVEYAFREYSSKRGFAKLLHIYFSAFLGRTIKFVVDKEISNHVALDGRFHSLDEVEGFQDALDVYASEISKIVDEFSGGWYSKTAWEKGEITKDAAEGFTYVALRKLKADIEEARN